MRLFGKLVCKMRGHKWIYVYVAPTGITHRMQDLPSKYMCQRCEKEKLLFPEILPDGDYKLKPLK